MMSSTTRDLAMRYRSQIASEMWPVERQVTDTTRQGRRQLLDHYAKVLRKVAPRGRNFVLLFERMI